MQLHSKFIKTFLAPLIVFFYMSNVYSQDIVQVNIQQPPLNQLRIEHLWKITLNNTSQDVLDVYLYGTLTEQTAGRIVTATTSSINLAPGVKQVNVPELEPISVDFPSAESIYSEALIRAGKLPSGEYEICVYVRYKGTNNDCGSDCIQHSIEIMPAPTLISPSDGENINTRPMFTWMQAVRPGTDARYKIKIVEVQDRQSSETAMQTNPAWFEEENIMTNVFQYPLSAKELVEVGKYAWQISSFDFFGNPIGENGGKSEVWMFTYKSTTQRMITREEAIEIIMSEVIIPDSLKHDIIAFLGRVPLKPGDKVKQDDADSMVIDIDKPTWFAWVYDNPQSFFWNPTRYVMINAISGEFEILIRGWPPLINSEAVWRSLEEWKGNEYKFFSTIDDIIESYIKP